MEALFNGLCESYDLVNNGSSLPEASLVIREERIDDGIYSVQQEVFHQFVGGTKKRDQLIALWGCLMFPRFKKADDIGTMPHPWYSIILITCIKEGYQS